MSNNSCLTALIEQSIRNNWDLNAFTDYNGPTLQYKDVARKIEKLINAPGTPCPVQSTAATYEISFLWKNQGKSPLTTSFGR